jgi:hypothetical protein
MIGLTRLAQVNKPLTHTTRHPQDLVRAVLAQAVVLCFHNSIVTMVEVRTKAMTQYAKTDVYKMLPAHVVLAVVV